MHSFGKTHRRTAAIVAAWLSVCVAAEAQQTAQARYEFAVERETGVRALLDDASLPASQLATQVTQAVRAYESVVRRFPTSGYADNALFQAASLAASAYETLKQPAFRERAIHLYEWLAREYPSSSLIKKANAQLTAMDPDTAAKPAVPAAPATLVKIQRESMRDAVRVTVELDREVEYFEQKLSGPERVFFDLRNVQVIPELRDQVLSYPSDVIGKIRIGRHPNAVVRVVLDMEDVQKHSVFTLYNPFRLVIDAERSPERTAAIFPPLIGVRPFNVASMFGVMPRAAFVMPERPELPLAPPEPLTAKEPRALPLPAAVRASVPAVPETARAAAPTPPTANAAGGFSIARQLGLSVSRIVIDPGHGGHDPGVLGKGLTEANLVLDVALRLEKLLQKDAGVEVVLTRRSDIYVPLEERTEIANRQNADMFLSIHANASRNEEARGIETFFLSFASSADAEAVAARENSASTREMHQLPDLIKAITLNSKLDESRDLATMVQESLVSNLRKSNKDVRSRGVKKAPFVVLIGASMPSVLAEISFVSNARELALLKTPGYRQKIAEALYTAVTKYRRSLKNQTLTALPER